MANKIFWLELSFSAYKKACAKNRKNFVLGKIDESERNRKRKNLIIAFEKRQALLA